MLITVIATVMFFAMLAATATELRRERDSDNVALRVRADDAERARARWR